jgi:hypothetical protein
LCRSGICGGKMLGFSQQPEFDVKIRPSSVFLIKMKILQLVHLL